MAAYPEGQRWYFKERTSRRLNTNEVKAETRMKKGRVTSFMAGHRKDSETTEGDRQCDKQTSIQDTKKSRTSGQPEDVLVFALAQPQSSTR